MHPDTKHTIQFSDIAGKTHRLHRVHSSNTQNEPAQYPDSVLAAARLATAQPEQWVFETVKGEFIPGHKVVSLSHRL